MQKSRLDDAVRGKLDERSGPGTISSVSFIRRKLTFLEAMPSTDPRGIKRKHSSLIVRIAKYP